jgi:replicative DNA helicase
MTATEARIPPHDLDAEGVVLSGILNAPERLDTILDILRPEHFYSEANRRIYEAVLDLSARGVPIDYVAVAGLLKDRDRLSQIGGAAYLVEIQDNIPFAPDLESHAKRIRNKARRRKLIATAQRIAAESYGPIEDDEAFFDSSEQAIFEIACDTVANTVCRVSEVTTAVWEQLELARQRRGVTGVATGLTDFDRLTGGAHRKQLTVVAARTSMGKTAFVTDVALRLADMGFGVAFFSPEMTKEEVVLRGACSLSRVNIAGAVRNALNDADRGELFDGISRIHRMPIWIDDTASPSLLSLRARIRRIKAECKQHVHEDGRPRTLGLVVVDGLQLCRGVRLKGMSREEEVASVARGLKEIAKDCDVPLWAVAQLSRAVETRNAKDNRPRLSDLRESGEIEQSADNVFFLYRDEYYDPDSKDKGIAELIAAKQRNGPRNAMVKLAFAAACTRFDNLAPGYHAGE